jgi:hypothetical protein
MATSITYLHSDQTRYGAYRSLGRNMTFPSLCDTSAKLVKDHIVKHERILRILAVLGHERQLPCRYVYYGEKPHLVCDSDTVPFVSCRIEGEMLRSGIQDISNCIEI